MIEAIKKNGTIIAVIAVVVLVLGMVFVLEEREQPKAEPVVTVTPEKTEAPDEKDVAEEAVLPTEQPKPEKTIQPTEATLPADEDKVEEYVLGEANTVRYTSESDKSSQQCTIEIYCNTLLNNMSLLDDKKHSLIPSDGCILSETEVEIEDGDSVFDILRKATKDSKIHMEFVNTPIYNSAYIEGINNIYEFDAGELSGWMYSVNGEFPNYGCSRYEVKTGDRIEWHYSCDLGRDVAGRMISQREE